MDEADRFHRDGAGGGDRGAAPYVRRKDLLVALAVCTGWLVSLALPALQAGEGAPLSGWTLLLDGWRAAGAGIWAWFANPLFFCSIGLLLAGRIRAARVLAALTLLLGLSSLATGPLAARAGYSFPELSFGSGFWLWLSSLLALCGWTWVAPNVKKKQW